MNVTPTIYNDGRNTTEKHEEILEKNGWTKYHTVIMDRDENDDLELTINTTKFNLSKYENSIQNTYVGSEI